ncbi:MAG: nitroreductase/quinone reductase family protein [Candidatus Binatia bacterium]
MDTTHHPIARATAPVPVPLPIRILRRMRPAIAWLLSSPLHAVLSRDVLLLAYRGRTSGRRYELPLNYVEHGGRLYLCTHDSRWWRNLRGGAPVELHLRGRRLQATPCVLASDSAEALDGLRAFLTRNPRTGALLYNVQNDAARRPLEGDLKREVRHSVVVRLEMATD